MRRGIKRDRLTFNQTKNKDTLNKKFILCVFLIVIGIIFYLVYHLLKSSNIHINTK